MKIHLFIYALWPIWISAGCQIRPIRLIRNNFDKHSIGEFEIGRSPPSNSKPNNPSPIVQWEVYIGRRKVLPCVVRSV